MRSCSSFDIFDVSTTLTFERSPAGIQPSGSPALGGCIPSSEPPGYSAPAAFDELRKPFFTAGLPPPPPAPSSSTILGAGRAPSPTSLRLDRHGPGSSASFEWRAAAAFCAARKPRFAIGTGAFAPRTGVARQRVVAAELDAGAELLLRILQRELREPVPHHPRHRVRLALGVRRRVLVGRQRRQRDGEHRRVEDDVDDDRLLAAGDEGAHRPAQQRDAQIVDAEPDKC